MNLARGSRILVTGGAGFIGSKLVPKLLEEGIKVRVIDSLVAHPGLPHPFEEHPSLEFVNGDIRGGNVLWHSLEGIDGVIHLAAIVLVTDSETERERELIRSTNYAATCELVEMSKKRHVPRFVFASTASAYGTSEDGEYSTEDDPLRPESEYAQSKALAEQYLLSAADDLFHPTVLRLAGVFGRSARTSYQSLFNALVRDAVFSQSLLIYSPGAWRPFVHVNDVVSAVLLALFAPIRLVSGEVFNVGSNSLNVRKGDLADLIKKLLPMTRLEIKGDVADLRNYRVSFDKIERVFGFQTTVTLEQGIMELKDHLIKQAV